MGLEQKNVRGRFVPKLEIAGRFQTLLDGDIPVEGYDGVPLAEAGRNELTDRLDLTTAHLIPEIIRHGLQDHSLDYLKVAFGPKTASDEVLVIEGQRHF